MPSSTPVDNIEHLIMGSFLYEEIKNPKFRLPVVLLVDDNAIVAHGVNHMLKDEHDITVHYCQDPATAIAKAIEVQPTVILLDLVMPKLDGLTLCRIFRDNQKTMDVPIVMLSANDDGLTKANSFASGANDYLVKLPDSIEFIARIRYHSKSFILKIERDEAYSALCTSQAALQEANKRLLKMAHQDQLTQLPNRPMLIERLSMTLAQAKRDGKSVAVLFCDLDDFKPVNDIHGHQAGDVVLKNVAQRMLSNVRETDTVARLGGDEFVVVLGALDDRESVTGVADKIIRAISAPIPIVGGKQVEIGISIGISIFPQHGKDIDRLMSYADHAMYESKRTGKNRHCFFNYI